MNSGIYCIRHLASGKVYVGSAINLRKRRNEHLSTLAADKHFNRHLQSAWNKYGAAAFEFAILERVDCGQLVVAEQRHIDALLAYSHGYNLRPRAASNLGMKMPHHVGEATRRAHTGRKWSAEIVQRRVEGMRASGGIERMRQKMTGRKQPAAQIAKRSAALRAGDGLQRIRAALTGRKASSESCAKRSASLRGRKMNPESARKSALTRTGMPRPDVRQWAPQKFSRFSAEDVTALRADRSSGLTYRQLAKKYRCTASTALLAVKGGGVFYATL